MEEWRAENVIDDHIGFGKRLLAEFDLARSFVLSMLGLFRQLCFWLSSFSCVWTLKSLKASHCVLCRCAACRGGLMWSCCAALNCTPRALMTAILWRSSKSLRAFPPLLHYRRQLKQSSTGAFLAPAPPCAPLCRCWRYSGDPRTIWNRKFKKKHENNKKKLRSFFFP